MWVESVVWSLEPENIVFLGCFRCFRYIFVTLSLSHSVGVTIDKRGYGGKTRPRKDGTNDKSSAVE